MTKIFILITICLLGTAVQAQWTQKGSDIDGEAAEDRSGSSVSMSSDGNTLAIGAPNNDGTGNRAGHVRIYQWSGTAWTQKGADIDGEAIDDFSGESVSLSSNGDILAIGAPGNNGTGTGAGHVRVYSWSGSIWTQKGADIDAEAAGDGSGFSVSISSDGNTVAIGAPNNDGTGTGFDAGHVRVYQWNGSVWTQKGTDIDGEGADDLSGRSVSLSSDGNTLAVGADRNDGTGKDAGHVRVYQWSGSAWAQKGADIDGEATDDRSGFPVFISSDGNTLAIGAVFNEGTGEKAGHVRVYQWSDSIWTQKGTDIDAEDANDQSGVSVSMSSDGNTLAIGAHLNNGTGENAGHVRVYQWSDSTWTQKGTDIDGEASNDRSGFSVSMSSDGNTLAIGAHLNSGTGNRPGHVRVYHYLSVDMIENGFDNDILLYPNPTNGNFSIDLGSDYELVTLMMTDINGKIIQSNIYRESQILNLKLDEPAGVYLLIIESGKKKSVIRLVKE